MPFGTTQAGRDSLYAFWYDRRGEIVFMPFGTTGGER